MHISKGEAFDLLSKWKNERTLVSGVWGFGDDGGVVFGGYIEEIGIGLTIRYEMAPNDKAVEIMFKLERATEFEYQDQREAPNCVQGDLKGTTSVLAIRTPTSRIAIYGRPVDIEPEP